MILLLEKLIKEKRNNDVKQLRDQAAGDAQSKKSDLRTDIVCGSQWIAIIDERRGNVENTEDAKQEPNRVQYPQGVHYLILTQLIHVFRLLGGLSVVLLYMSRSGLPSVLLRGGTSPNRFGQHMPYLKVVWIPKPLQRRYTIETPSTPGIPYAGMGMAPV